MTASRGSKATRWATPRPTCAKHPQLLVGSRTRLRARLSEHRRALLFLALLLVGDMSQVRCDLRRNRLESSALCTPAPTVGMQIRWRSPNALESEGIRKRAQHSDLEAQSQASPCRSRVPSKLSQPPAYLPIPRLAIIPPADEKIPFLTTISTGDVTHG